MKQGAWLKGWRDGRRRTAVLVEPEPNTCPTCGQRVLIRLGARLRPMAADLFDAIAVHKETGILGEQLIWMFWPNASKRQAQNVLHQTIHQINDLIAPAGFKIGAGGKGLPYRIWRIHDR